MSSKKLTKPPIKFKDCLHLVILKDEDTENYYCGGCHTKAAVTLLRIGRRRFSISMDGFGEDSMFLP